MSDAETHYALHMHRTDAIARRIRFEAAHPEVTITPPGGLNQPWRAIVPGREDPVSAWQLGRLLDQLAAIYGNV